jgi:hypothetical protein
VDFGRESLGTKLRDQDLCFLGDDDEGVEVGGIVENPFDRTLMNDK